METTIPVKLFQGTQRSEASEYLYGMRSKGEIAAGFLYQSSSEVDAAHGSLYVFLPDTHGFTYPGHEAIKQRFTIQDFRQREQIVLWIKDSEIEEALKLVASAIAPVK